jgi:hypothetical protein
MGKTPIDVLLDRVNWTRISADDPATNKRVGLPVATHEGVLHLGRVALKVYKLSDGRRLISEESIRALLSAVGGEE